MSAPKTLVDVQYLWNPEAKAGAAGGTCFSTKFFAH
jgi:hypothetical protein